MICVVVILFSILKCDISFWHPWFMMTNIICNLNRFFLIGKISFLSSLCFYFFVYSFQNFDYVGVDFFRFIPFWISSAS